MADPLSWAAIASAAAGTANSARQASDSRKLGKQQLAQQDRQIAATQVQSERAAQDIMPASRRRSRGPGFSDYGLATVTPAAGPRLLGQ